MTYDISQDGEDAWLARAFALFSGTRADEVLEIGLGDDAASVRVDGDAVIVATDVLVDGVHFDLAACGPAAAAAKALKVNLSDLAAMGARPLAFLVGGVLPRPADLTLFDGFMAGFFDVAKRYDCVCAGGDTNAADGPLVLAVTVMGQALPGGPVSRRGAEPGDVVSVTGPLGGSLLGRHLSFEPRLAEAAALVEARVPKAMIDVSDGLARDLSRLCRASGVGARVDATWVPVHDDAVRACGADPDGPGPLERAYGDGEDFELLLAHAPLDDGTRATLEASGVTLIEIGVITEGAGVIEVRDGVERPLEDLGYDHILGCPEPDDAFELVVSDTAAMERLGKTVAGAVRPFIDDGFVLDLRGELGMGKTVLARGLARALGVPPRIRVTSPTFTLAREYAIDGGHTLQHVDAYRMSGASEIDSAGFEEMCEEGVLTCVEWGGRVDAALPADRLEITIVLESPESVPLDLSEAPELPRRVTLRALGPRARQALDVVKAEGA